MNTPRYEEMQVGQCFPVAKLAGITVEAMRSRFGGLVYWVTDDSIPDDGSSYPEGIICQCVTLCEAKRAVAKIVQQRFNPPSVGHFSERKGEL